MISLKRGLYGEVGFSWASVGNVCILRKSILRVFLCLRAFDEEKRNYIVVVCDD